MRFQDQVVLITGGAGGLGTELSKRYLCSGARVYVCDNHPARLQRASREIEAAAESFGRYYRQDFVDVRDVARLRAWIEAVIGAERRIDILVNAAGVCPVKSIPEITEEIWDEVVDVNLKSAFFAGQATAGIMKEQRYGRIVFISSIAAYTGGAIASPPYSAAKMGLIALTKSFANALSPHGITVNAVSPGPFETEMIADFPKDAMERIVSMTPNRRLGRTEDVAGAILFLTDPATSHITGATLDINGGLYLR